jgi:hypothetical protein
MDKKQAYKNLRYNRRNYLKPKQRPNSNPSKCGICRRTQNVSIRMKDKSAYYHGLVNCGNVWACPVCSRRISIERGKEVQEFIQSHRKTGGDVYMITATIPHDQGDRLKPLRQSVSKAWQKTISGRPWIAMKEKIGFVGFVRALEVTHGKNGWHPHLHILIATETILTDTQRADLEEFLSFRWADRIERAGYRRPSREHGLRVSHGENAGNYITKITKQGMAEEISGHMNKSGRNGSRSILQIVDDWHENKSSIDELLIEEWLSGMFGARQLTWSKGLRKLYLKEEQSDYDIVQDENESEDKLFLEIDGKIWDKLMRSDKNNAFHLLCLAEKDGIEGVNNFLNKQNFGNNSS